MIGAQGKRRTDCKLVEEFASEIELARADPTIRQSEPPAMRRI
jgi:hypothetical protein